MFQKNLVLESISRDFPRRIYLEKCLAGGAQSLPRIRLDELGYLEFKPGGFNLLGERSSVRKYISALTSDDEVKAEKHISFD